MRLVADGKAMCDAHRAEAIEKVGLLDKAMAQSRTLSGGQKRKLSVAIAFLGDPRVVFLDEVENSPLASQLVTTLLSFELVHN